jgi:pimeloyl-ACP methyl ester carboxylesterase
MAGVRFFKNRDGHRIAYADEGDGVPLVLPAWWVTHLERDAEDPDYRRFFDALAQHFRVVRYDRLGVGLSDRVARTFTAAGELADLETLVEHLGSERVHLFALSCAGPTALAFAAHHPERVGKIVLYASYLEGAKVAKDNVKQALAALVRAHWGLGSNALAEVFTPGADAAVQRAFRKLQRFAADAETAAQLLELTYALDASPFVERIRAPVLILHRREDHAIRYEEGRKLAARVSGARFVTLEGKIHLPWAGDTRPILDEVLAFLKGAGGKKTADAEAELRRDGEVWTLRFEDRTVLLKDAKGVADLARLLARPGEELHVLDILGVERPKASPAEPSLDRKALASYRARLRDIEEAMRDKVDDGRGRRLAREREALLRQLAADTGLGGRVRRLNDAGERARKTVTARIRDTIRRIRQVHPRLGEHLQRSVATGLFCVYRPRQGLRWTVAPDASELLAAGSRAPGV